LRRFGGDWDFKTVPVGVTKTPFKDWLDAAVDDGNSVLRLLHYSPIPADAEGG
jgi:hypothetical protein